jgi:putative transposase
VRVGSGGAGVEEKQGRGDRAPKIGRPAVDTLIDEKLIYHSDAGSVDRVTIPQQRLRPHVAQQRPGRLDGPRQCGDNAAMESFFALLQKNVLDRQRWATREDLRLAIITWIEKTYHRRRRQRPLGRLPQ